ncbi:maleylacetate reductase [Flexivirga meconopsidis]|uniref:maleylacetate reductase n=1 Tax=Flexivirga meconopsidis TaxID=2977121 RepID=UPI002240DD10
MSRRRFTVTEHGRRVRFGPSALAELPDALAELDSTRALVVCTAGQRDLAQAAVAVASDRVAGVFDGAVMHVPAECADLAVAHFRDRAADAVVAVGGSSSTGLAKAIALRCDAPIVAVPTTYAGSEMTPVWGLTESGVKRTGREERVRPAAVLYDPKLTVSLPVPISVTSGFNAIAHAVEASYAPDGNRFIDLLADEGVRSLLSGMPKIVADPADSVARSDALYGAWMCGATLGETTMGLHHALCHRLGGALNLPHADTHTVLLPYVLAFNAEAADRIAGVIAAALDTRDPAPVALQDAARAWGAPTSLAELGVSQADLSRVSGALAGDYVNPRPVTGAEVTQLLRRALAGEAPTAH